jgi:5-hydroxyisourate hydrolase-like protein (transthyretin family)
MLMQASAVYAAPVYINGFADFPAYPYNTSAYVQGGAYVGCGPTTGAMIFGYFQHHFGLTGLLTSPVAGVNEGLSTAWVLHGSSYMKTGSNGFGSVYDIKPGLENYAADRGFQVKVMAHAATDEDPATSWYNDYGPYGVAWTNDGNFWLHPGGVWSIDPNLFCDFVATKLSAGVCVFLTVDSDSVEGGDHWIPCVGYDKAAGKYYYYNTYDTTLRNAPIAYTGSTPGAGDYAISFVRTVTYIPKSVGYSVNIWAFANNEGWMDWIPITKDGAATGYNTPHNFTGLTGTHTFTVPANDGYGRLFYKWSTGWTGRTLTVNSSGTYTAYYESPYSVNVWAFADKEGWMDWIPITKDGAPTGKTTPYNFTGLAGPHTFTVPATEPMGRVFYKWSTGWTGTTLTVNSTGTYTAYYRWGTLTAISPNGGEQWIRGTAHTLKWSSTGNSGVNVKIELMKGGVLNRVISSSTANDGSYYWTIPSTQTLGTDYKIRITSTSHTMVTDSSNSNFAIVNGTLTVTSPNGGEKWINGTTHTLTWTSAGNPGAHVKIELLKGGVVNRNITLSTANDGSYSWTIPSKQTLGTDYKIRITSTTYTYVTDSSNSNFAIVRGTLTVTSPNGAEKWINGTTHTVTWTSAGNPGAHVKIELLKGGVVNRIITSSTLNNGSYSWKILSTQTLGTDYKIRITSTTYSIATDSSNSNFAIVRGTLTVVSPNGGQQWVRGTTHTITWSKAGTTGSYVKIELLKGGVVNRVISSSTLNDGSYSWTIPSAQTLGTDYKIRITSTTYTSITDSSNSNFSIIT